jgi:hypothetical protein
VAAPALAILLSICFVLVAVFAGELVPPGMRDAGCFWLIGIAVLWVYGVGAVARVVGIATRSRLAAFAAAIAVSLTTLHLSCGPMYYRGVPFRGRVIEYPARTPVPDATIRAEWKLLSSTNLHGTEFAGLMHVANARTGTDGSFTIPGWRPVIRPVFAWIGEDNPLLIVGARGRFGNQWNDDDLTGVAWRTRFSSRRLSAWDGRDLLVYRWDDLAPSP